tara:strand:+ start:603 stop:770 length:168 start_codon:yes stop_codon:yes gene_type:complete
LVVAFILIIEGIIPLFYPNRFKAILSSIIDMTDKSLRILGLACIITGLMVYYLVI